jgi:hypothetical protein
VIDEDFIVIEMTQDCAFFEIDEWTDTNPKVMIMKNARKGRTEKPDQWIVHKHILTSASGMQWYMIHTSASGNPEFQNYYIRVDKSRIT